MISTALRVAIIVLLAYWVGQQMYQVAKGPVSDSQPVENRDLKVLYQKPESLLHYETSRYGR